MAHHHLAASPQTVHWGWFDAALAPVLEIESGDSVTIETVSGGPDNLPGPGFHVPPELLRIHAEAPRRQPGHILTGPVAVRGASPGDLLELRIDAIALRQDWGYTYHRPLAGGLPLDFERGEQMIVPLEAANDTSGVAAAGAADGGPADSGGADFGGANRDGAGRGAGIARLPWGTDLPLRPFFGVMGVAPPPGWGTISTIQPRMHGGNLDNRELVAGSRLYLPVHAAGGLFSVGDGHGAQGDGEVCVTAIETALGGRFTLILHKGPRAGAPYPRAETPRHLVTMGMHADLDQAAQDALRRMIDWVTALGPLSRSEAYMLLSLAGDLRVTQIVNQEKGVHMMLDKALLPGGAGLDWAGP